jgi:ornithine carbamoyltransferase
MKPLTQRASLSVHQATRAVLASTLTQHQRSFSTVTPPPAHFITTADYTADQLFNLVDRAIQLKVEAKYQFPQSSRERPLAGKTMALLFSKLSTRTRVATESSVAYLGKERTHMPLFAY